MQPTHTRCLFIVCSMLLGACDRGDPAAIQHRVELQRFETCSDLDDYIKDTAVLEMRQILDQQWKSYQDRQQWAGGGRDAGMAASADAGGSGSAPLPVDGEPAASTRTNTQVAEVDEADFVKNDGKRILVLARGQLQLARSWPVTELSLVSTLPIEGQPLQMFLDKDRVVVFSTVPASDGSAGCFGGCYGGQRGMTKATLVDISNLAVPKITSELYFPGSYSNARRVGPAVRLVLSDSFRHPEGLSYYPSSAVYGSEWWKDLSRLAQAYDDLKRKNEQLIRQQPLESWLPLGTRKLADGSTAEVRYGCTDFYRSNAPVKLGMVSIVSLDLDDLAAQPHRTSFLGNAGEIYAGASSLYIASRHWWWGEPGQSDHTYLHKFDISDARVARYVASGGVDGQPVDQFAMDEHKGFLRVATTVSSRVEEPSQAWGGGSWWRTETRNRVEVLREEAGRLVPTGSVENLAKGERIMSARFQGDRGYLVTFRQVDPLFTLDLSDPSAPRVVGELKVPGFSTYIHPLDADHLLTMGIHVPDPATAGSQSWRERAMKLSIFDISDFAAPKETFTTLVGTATGWSEAAYEHKAFNFFAERKLLAIPFSDYQWDQSSTGGYWDHFISELRVFRVDAKTGFRSEGALSMKDIYVSRNDTGWSYDYSPWIHRSVMAADSQGHDYVYAISDAGIRVAQVGGFDAPIQTALFEAAK